MIAQDPAVGHLYAHVRQPALREDALCALFPAEHAAAGDRTILLIGPVEAALRIDDDEHGQQIQQILR